MNPVAVLLWAFSALWAAYVALTVTPVLVPNLSLEAFTAFRFHFAVLAGGIMGAGLFDKYSGLVDKHFTDSRLTSTRSEDDVQAEGNRVVTSWGYVKMDKLDRWEVGQKMLETVRKELGGIVEESEISAIKRRTRRGKRKEVETSVPQNQESVAVGT